MTITEEDNLAIFLQPGEWVDNFPFFVAGVAMDKTDKVMSVPGDIPGNWEGKYVTHFMPVAPLSEFFKDEWFAEHKITHLALLESTQGGSDPFFFNGAAITHTSMVVWFSEVDKTFHYIHCRQCAYTILQWLVTEQEKWVSKATLAPATLN